MRANKKLNILAGLLLITLVSCESDSCKKAISTYENDEYFGDGYEVSDRDAFCEGYTDSRKSEKNYYILLGEKHECMDWFYDSLKEFGCAGVKWHYGDMSNGSDVEYVLGWDWYQKVRMRREYGTDRVNNIFKIGRDSCLVDSCKNMISAYENDSLFGNKVSNWSAFCAGYFDSDGLLGNYYYLPGEKSDTLKWFYDSLKVLECIIRMESDIEADEQYINGWNWYQVVRVRKEYGVSRVNDIFARLKRDRKHK